MLDRTTPPAFNTLTEVKIPNVQSTSLSNGRSFFYLEDNNTQVFKIDLLLKAGSWYADNYAIVPTTLKLLNEGSLLKTAKELADAFNRYGSFIELTPGFDHCTISLYGLTKYFSQNLEILAELIFTPAFDQNSFDNLKQRDIQKLKLNLEKGSYLASVSLRQNIFGGQHPYGKRITPEDIQALSLNDVQNFYSKYFQAFDVLLSGNFPPNFVDTIDNHLGKTKLHITKKHTSQYPNHNPESKVSVRNSKFIQSSVRIGKKLFNRSNHDYMSFMVLNEILGGYFGSRLMKNIREEKGFTYGIYSQLYSLNHAGYFSISTDVNGENEQQTIDEVFKEIELLQTQPVSANELHTVKNYMAGTFAGSISSPFSIMDKFRAVHYQNLNLSFFQNYIHTIHTITTEDLFSMASKHLKPDGLSIITVGK